MSNLESFLVFGREIPFDKGLIYGDLHRGMFILRDVIGWVPLVEQCTADNSEENRQQWLEYVNSRLETYHAAVPELRKLDAGEQSSIKLGYCAADIKGQTAAAMINTITLYSKILHSITLAQIKEPAVAILGESFKN